MIFSGRTYSVLVVSSSEKFNTTVKGLLSESDYSPVTFAKSTGEAQRILVDKTYDLVIINSPLSDGVGTDLAIDVSGNQRCVCMILVGNGNYELLESRVTDYGVYTLLKPFTAQNFMQAVKWLAVSRERLRKLEKKTLSLNERMDEIRIVNRAKWVLIDQLHMTEPDAHRYIEKQAMDRCCPKREIAESIIKTYSVTAGSL